jgi:ubiquinone/menaquinone biosynthesis C-methylase UbiE
MNILKRKKRKFYFYGWLYDRSLELVLSGMKKRISGYIYQYSLFPAIDICCGTGKQCHLVDESRHDDEIITGLDLDLRMMRFAVAKYPHLPFICADALNIPIKDRSVRGIIVSYSLHDKPPDTRKRMLEEAKRLLAPEGRIILLDFEQPWNRRSRVGRFFTYLIERMAGREHFRNGQQFMRQGGLQSFIKSSGLKEIKRHDIEIGNSSIVVAKFA